MKDMAASLVSFAAQLRFEDIPEPVVQIVTMDVLDFFGNALGGSSDTAVRLAAELMTQDGGRPDATVLAGDAKLPAASAAFLNAMMGFALDYDDTHERANTHVGVACIPAALAAAELVGGVDGKRFLTAVTAAMEISARIGIGCKRKIPAHIMGGWDYAALHGGFSAAVAAGMILGLNEQQLLHSLGIAYQQLGGNTLSAVEEADTKKMGPGFAARNGVTAARMAAMGLTGCRSVFHATPYSLFNMYHDGGDPVKALEGLGEVFVLQELGFKPWPCCRLGHRYIDTLLALIKDEDIQPQEVVALELKVCSQVDIQLCQPPEGKQQPTSKNAAQFSLPWMCACALVRRRVGVGEFLPETLQDQELLQMARKIRTHPDPQLHNETESTEILLRTTRGDFVRRTGKLYGNPDNPMDLEALKNKFLDNVGYCVREIPEPRCRELLEQLENLSALEDVRRLML